MSSVFISAWRSFKMCLTALKCKCIIAAEWICGNGMINWTVNCNLFNFLQWFKCQGKPHVAWRLINMLFSIDSAISSNLSPLTLSIVRAPQITLQQYLSTFPYLSSAALRESPFLSILWCYLPSSSMMKQRTRQERVATDTQRSPGCRTTPLEHWSKRKPTVEPRCLSWRSLTHTENFRAKWLQWPFTTDFSSSEVTL